MKVQEGDVGGMWGEGGSKEFFLFFPSFFWCGTLTIKHGEGVLTMVLWRGVWRYVYT